MFLSAFRSCHFLPANSSVSANRAHRSPPSCGSASLRARPLVQAAVPQKGPRHHEQQLHLQHVPPSASGHKVWISQQQNYSQSWWEMSFLPRLQGETSTLQEEQTLTRFFLCVFHHSLRKTHPSCLFHFCVPCPLLPGRKRNKSKRRRCHR